jgi:ribonuclease P/MRP protein subunit POP5
MMVSITRDRYVVITILAKGIDVSVQSIKSEVWQTYQKIYGISGSSSAGLYFEHFDEKSQTGIIRCSHDSLSHLLTVLALITSIDNQEVLLYPSYVSGVINKAKKFLSKS